MVKLGDTNLQHDAPKVVTVPVQDIVIHQEYSATTTAFGTISNDIALVLLSFPVNYSTHIQPVCLPIRTFQLQVGTECWVTGWGKRSENGKPGSQEVEIPGLGGGFPVAWACGLS